MKNVTRIIFSFLFTVCLFLGLSAQDATSFQDIKTDIDAFSIAPNPAQHTSTVSYAINKKAQVQLVVYSLSGELVFSLLDDEFPAGEYCISFNTASLAKGAYVVTLRGGATQLSKKLIKK